MLTPVYLTVPAVVCIIGALVYGISSNPKAAEMGRLAFACGILAALLSFAHR